MQPTTSTIASVALREFSTDTLHIALLPITVGEDERHVSDFSD
jgi:hypothetical protein